MPDHVLSAARIISYQRQPRSKILTLLHPWARSPCHCKLPCWNMLSLQDIQVSLLDLIQKAFCHGFASRCNVPNDYVILDALQILWH